MSSTASPTAVPATEAASILIAIGVIIFGLLLALIWGSFIFHGATASRQYELEVEALKKAPCTTEEERKELEQKVEALLQKRASVSQNLIGPTLGSDEANSLQQKLFHTELGRSIAIGFIELNTQISWMLGFCMMWFMQQFVTQEIILVSPNVGHAYMNAIGVVFTLYFLHKLLYTTASQYIQRKMGGNTIFDTSNPVWAANNNNNNTSLSMMLQQKRQ
jgi:hypothetical protein